MGQLRWTAVVTLVAMLVYFGMSMRVAGARGASGIEPPTMTGDPVLERAVRVQGNTLEWLPLFLTGLWLFAAYWSDRVAASLGVVWILGRLLYAVGYMEEPKRRSAGFLIQMAATTILLLGALGRVGWTLMA